MSITIKAHESQYQLLRNALESNDFICISGLPSVGKTTFVTRFLDKEKCYVYAHINCYHVATPTKLYSCIAESLGTGHKIRARGRTETSLIRSLLDFKEFFQDYHQSVTKNTRTTRIFVILDHVELFKRTSLMEAVVSLSTIPDMLLILITESVYETLDTIKAAAPRLRIQNRTSIIELAPWTKSDLIQLILLQPPRQFDDLYRKFVNNVVAIVHSKNTNDPVEIRSFCQENFGTFIEFYKTRIKALAKKNGMLDSDSSDISDSELEEYSVDSMYISSSICSFLDSFKTMVARKDIRSIDQRNLDIKVALGTNIMIVAAYVAAYTRPSHDKRNFVKFQKKRLPKRANSDYVSTVSSNRPFTLERLLQIYACLNNLSRGISDDGKENSMNHLDSIASDVKLLQDLSILKCVGGDGLDSLSRFRISDRVERDYVQRSAQQVDLSLTNIYGLP